MILYWSFNIVVNELKFKFVYTDRSNKRNKIKVNQSLDELTAAANTDKNLIPKIINCAEQNCTLGEIVFALKKVFGEYWLKIGTSYIELSKNCRRIRNE